MTAPLPNILLITLDECRQDALSCYGNPVIQTPGMDRIAAAGTRFTSAFAPSPLCLPSRCSLLSGLYPHRSGAYSNFRQELLDPARPNLYNILRGAGYHTAHAGKCHYTPAPYGDARPDATVDRENVRDFYLSLGMDALDLCNGKWGSVWFWNDYSRELEEAGHLTAYRNACHDKPNNRYCFPFPGPAAWHPDAWTGRKAIERVQGHDAAQPLFLWCSFSGPHYPLDPPQEYLDRVDASLIPPVAYAEGEFAGNDKIQAGAFTGRNWRPLVEGAQCTQEKGLQSYGDEDWRRTRHHYLANVVLIDDWVTRLLDAAEARFGDNLLVIVTADHGDTMGDHRLWGKNRCAYDSVLRVPFLMRLPGEHAGAGSGAPSDARIVLCDILPTLCQAAGVTPPDGLDGRPISESLRDGGPEILLSAAERFFVAHDRQGKLILDTDIGISEFYDLARDPFETRNAIDDPACAPRVARLARAMAESLMSAALA